MSDPNTTDIAGIVTYVLCDIMIRNGNAPPDRGPQLYSLPFDDFKLDSMDKLDFVMAIEDKLERVFDANEIVQCKTLGDVIKLAAR